ncbi:MAG: N-acetyltransferase DgcN [Pseudomonadota bacterium]
MDIRQPYLLFLGDAPDALAAKVAQGIVDWRPEIAVGQFCMDGCNADMGLSDLTISEAADKGVKTLVVGVANRGGVISDPWIDVLMDALDHGMDIAAGLHNRLADIDRLKAKADSLGRTLFDVRHPSHTPPIANGTKRPGKRLLTVGTDCSCGKMYSTLAIEKEMQARGMKATFRATGQTGILVEGSGIAIDAVVSDFLAGSVEELSPTNDPDHWDVIEGQGSVYHPSYAGVTVGLIHGAQAEALVMCHEPTRTHMRGLPGYQLPTIGDTMETVLRFAKRTNPDAGFVGICVNTKALSEEEAKACLAEIEAEYRLPTVDPVRFGSGRIVDGL